MKSCCVYSGTYFVYSLMKPVVLAFKTGDMIPEGMEQKNIRSDKTTNWPVLWGLLTFLLTGALCASLVYLELRVRKNESDKQMFTVAETIRSRIQQSLQYSLSATQTMALTLNRNGEPVNFDSVARYVLSYNKFIDAVQLAPNGVIRWIYPLDDHRAVLGYDVLSDPLRRAEALKALEKRELFFAGPFELKQGGLGIVGRLPVFLNDKFWGFSSVVIRINTLLMAAGIDSTGASGYYYQLSKVNPYTGKEEFFLPIKNSNHRAYEISVTVPDGAWKLSVFPRDAESYMKSTIVLALLAVILSVISGVFVYHRSKLPARLNQLATERTVELRKSLDRNKAIVNALPDMMVVINANDEFVDYNNPMGHHTILPPEQFLGRKVAEIMPPDLVRVSAQLKEKVLKEQCVATHQYTMDVNGEKRYFEARYAPQSASEVLILVRDITDTAMAEERIRESEIRYRTLVEQAGDAILISDLQGKILVANPAASRMSQYDNTELLAKSVHELTPAEQLREMPFKISELATGATVTSERKLLRKDGSIIDVEITAKLVTPDRFLAFVRDISERKQFEEELLKSREDLRKLSNYIAEVREEERLHISREIHDELGQHLTVLKMDVSRIAKKAVAANDKIADDFKDILEAINDMVLVVRRISTELRPGMLDDLGLVAAIEWYSQDFGKKTGIDVSFISNITDEDFSRERNIGIFRILQESLTNVARHAKATKADVSLVRHEGQIVLMIEDNGRGFDNSFLENRNTLGLLGMKERARMMGGTYNIQSHAGSGTVVEVILPDLV